jgi:hypothetical protein
MYRASLIFAAKTYETTSRGAAIFRSTSGDTQQAQPTSAASGTSR